MSQALLVILPTFVPDFRRAIGVNLALAADAFVQGVPVGLLLGALRLPLDPEGGAGRCARRWRHAGARVADAAVGLMRAAPTFVVMYVLLEALPAAYAPHAAQAVAGALAIYAAAYVADNLLASLSDARAGARAGALPFAMGLLRLYFVMVLASGFGAAVGVTEATALTLRTLQALPTAADRLCVMAGVVAVFIAMRLLAFAAIACLMTVLRRGDPR